MTYYSRCVYLSLTVLLLSVLFGCSDNHGSSGPSAVTLRTYYYTMLNDAPWVAFQDGDGPWQALSPVGTGVYTAPVTDARGRYSLAVVTSTRENQPLLSLYHATTRELPAVECNLMDGAEPSSTTATGTVSGFPPDAVYATVGSTFNYVYPDNPTYNYSFVGLRDLAASLRTPFSVSSPRKIAFQRDLPAVPGGTITADFDFSTVPETTPGTITIANGAASFAYMQMITANGTRVQLAYPSGGTFTSFPCVYPASTQRVAGDVFAVQAYSVGPSEVNYAEQFFTSAGNRTVTLPQSFSGEISADLTAADLPTAGWQAYPNASYYTFDFRQSPNIFFMRDWQILLSRDWLDGATTYTAPDLSGVPGWQSAWLFDGPLTLVIADAHKTTGNISQTLTAWYGVTPGPAPANLTHTYARRGISFSQGLVRDQFDALAPRVPER